MDNTMNQILNKTLPEQIIQMNQEDEQEDWSEYCAPGTICHQFRVVLSNDVSLRVISFYPQSESHLLPVVMLPGLVSVMPTFKNILIELTRHFVVHYVETRDKSSSLVEKGANYDVDAIGSDIVEVISHLQLKDQKYILFGASLSATAIIDSYQYLEKYPFCLVLLEPNAVFDYPKWSLPLIRFSAPLYSVIKPFAKWYIKKFRVNTEEDYEMYRITSRALDAADPRKLKNTILAISKYQIWDRLSSVQSPTLIVCASKDTFHRHDDITRIVSRIKNSTYLDLEVHKRTHSKEFVGHFRIYIKNLKKSNLGENHETQKK